MCSCSRSWFHSAGEGGQKESDVRGGGGSKQTPLFVPFLCVFAFMSCLPTAGDGEEPDLAGKSLCEDNKGSFTKATPHPALAPTPPQVEARLETLLPQQLQAVSFPAAE